ncbi:Chaperone protein dnaJ [Quillaja saponaria]|uniref:Chaperone protein dnaJ n=1 Tax=Quillaja saponaria TaxID=32244 RepID=A0AAD7P5B8_QUISA|nr:Chaperone protein dnaJ [Quillaja saponaria]
MKAYAILSDPNARYAYDKEQAKVSELKGFTGKPIYSVWFGSESEERAIFVDEIKCVGCLKCALLAEKTFAIESVYGRARVVAQWADPENRIQEAIEACPVNCISVVERSNLAALEFLMSKQPRGIVRVGAGNTAGTRVSNIFVDVQKFQTRFQEAMEKRSTQTSKETDFQRQARMSAVQAIKSIANWLYWQSPIAGRAVSEPGKSLTAIAYKSSEPNIDKLRDAAARKQVREKARTNTKVPLNNRYSEDYWTPTTYALPSSTRSSSSSRAAKEPSETKVWIKTDKSDRGVQENQNNPVRWGFPMITALIAVAIVRQQQGAVSGLEQHIGGSLALDIVNSSWLQTALAGATWYMIGMAIIDLIAIAGSRER